MTTVRITCPYCNGSAANPDEPTCACEYCMGSGKMDMDPPSILPEPIGDTPEPVLFVFGGEEDE